MGASNKTGAASSASSGPNRQPRTKTAKPTKRTLRLAVWGMAAASAIVVLLAAAFRLNERKLSDRPWLQDADRLLAARQLDDADRLLERWLAARPDSASAHFFRARLGWARNDGASLAQGLREAQSRGYDPRAIARLEALVQTRLGEYGRAEPILRAIFAEGPGFDVEVAEALARIYLESYRLDLAEIVLSQWRQKSPRDAKPYIWQLEIDRRADTGDPTAGITNARKALEIDPSSKTARLALADLLRNARRAEEAETEYRRGLGSDDLSGADPATIAPEDPAALAGLGQVLAELGKPEEGVERLRAALEQQAALRKRQDQERQRDPNARPAPLKLDDAVAWKALGDLEMRARRFEAALRAFEEAAKFRPAEAEIAHLRSLVLTQLGRVPDAKREQERAAKLRLDEQRLNEIRGKIAREPNNIDLKLEMAEWMLDHGQDREGLRWLELILRESPKHQATLRRLASHHRARGNPGLARYYEFEASNP